MKMCPVKHCSSCGEPHSRFRNQTHTQPAAYCLSCHAAYMRRTRPAYAALAADVKARSNARAYANVYQSRGKLQPLPCETCGSESAEKHHDDYTRPLAVRWLCRPCHLGEHRSWSSSVLQAGAL